MPLDLNTPFPKRPRLKDRTSYTGIRGYLITITTHNRKKYFTKRNIVKSVVKYLDDVAKDQQFDVVSYCFMPDHLHLVLSGQYEDSSLEKFMKLYKQKTGFYFKQKFKTKLWDTGYYDCVLRKIENIKTVGRYTLCNPIKAGLVNNILDYPFCGSFVYDLEELVGDDPFLNVLDNTVDVGANQTFRQRRTLRERSELHYF